MEDTDLPVSPRKKAKLEEPSYVADRANTAMEVPSSPEVVPHNHSATTENQLSTPATMSSAYIPNFLETPTATLDSFTPPFDYKPDDPRFHTLAAMAFYQKLAEVASMPKSYPAPVEGDSDDIHSKETSCGITEFVRPKLMAFSGILKKRYDFRIAFTTTLANLHRYTDFLVNEILPSGEVVHLDNLEAPPKQRQNTEQFGNDGKSSAANSTEQGLEATQRTDQNVEEREQPCASKDMPQAIPHADTSSEDRTTVKPKVDPPAIEPSQAIPHSMQGFDQYEPAPASVDNPEKISPHKRIPPPAPSIPLSMQDLDGKQSEPTQEKTTRRKEKVHIRQTSQGWVEFDKEKEDEIKKRKAEEDEATGIHPEEATQTEDTMPEGSKEASESKELHQVQTSIESTQASWQAFANSAPSNGFQVSSSPI